MMPVQGDQEVEHARAIRRIQVPGRFVGEEVLRSIRERAGDRHALLLASGELRRVVVRPVAETDLVDQRLRPLARVLGRGGELKQRRTFSYTVSDGIR